ncbi:MAG TPA: arabinosyltransferase domain-containing protein [Pseudonocardiaceae bacterium]|nr:arabinosyltransferase domain-containing protein [Pseudonocardiaceae bacterium]
MTIDRNQQGEPDRASRRPADRRLRLLAAGFGLIGTLLALSVPFLPVHHDDVTLSWPTQQGTRAVSAPLTGYQPISVDASVPCTSLRSLAARSTGPAVAFSTTPPRSAYSSVTGMAVQVAGSQVTVVDDGTRLASTTIPTTGSCALTVHSDGSATTVNLAGNALATVQGDERPQVTGIYSDLDASRDDVHGLSVRIAPDTRFQTAATALKVAVMVLAVLALVGAALAMHQLDRKVAIHRLRLAPKHWWRPTGLDLAVLGVLIVWWLIGAGTSDDGYILVMARDEAANGYIGNIFRWFNSPEAPFGWFYELYARWVRVSTTTPWTRLPALLMSIMSWLLISREALPRLGTMVRRSKAAGWAAAGAFLAFWLPYDNGLRPESVVVLWTLISMCAVERAVANRRLAPMAVALFAAGFAVAATPTGLIAIAPLLAAAVPLIRLIRGRAHAFGWLSTLTPLTSAGTIVLLAVFANQTLRSVMDSTIIRTAIGPAESWYQETDRYEALFTNSPDGSLERRFPVLLIGLCVLTCVVVLLRRGKIPGAAIGPSRRLIAITVMSFALLALTPTKWTHHFGAFAALGGSMAALTAMATGASALRSRRNRALFTAGLLLVTAVALTGPNAWFDTANWGSPWFDQPPSLHGHLVSSALLGLAVIALFVAGIEHLRGPLADRPPVSQSTRLRWASAPVALVCAVLVLAEVVNFGKVIEKQGSAYSLGKDNVEQLAGNSCGVSDYTDVEADPTRDILSPMVPGAQPSTLTGFQRGGIPSDEMVDPNQRVWLPDFSAPGDAGTVWGNYNSGAGTSRLTTAWYALPARAHAQNSVLAVDIAGTQSASNTVTVQFARQTATGPQVISSQQLANVAGPAWRESRLSLTAPATGADEIRVTAAASGAGDWLAVTPPRVPNLVQMTSFIGNSPTFVEWTSAQGYPCLRPFDTSDGISEMPKYWLSSGETLAASGQQWSGPAFGGPNGWINAATSVRLLPTYLRNDINRDWGSLYAIDQDVPDALPANAAMTVQHTTHWGWYSPGPNSKIITNTGTPPSPAGP